MLWGKKYFPLKCTINIVVNMHTSVPSTYCKCNIKIHFPNRSLEAEVKMANSEMFGIRLEMDDRTEEERARCKAAQSLDGPLAPMDTDFQEEIESDKDQLRFNANFDR